MALTDQGGNLREKLAYDAWGKRRTTDGKPVNGTVTPDTIDGQIDNRGFTGHEMLDQIDLVHMNGRVYDPLLAKFLSGDPLITSAHNGQNYNRFSYVLNNPTNFTDPSGFSSQTVTIVGDRYGQRMEDFQRLLLQMDFKAFLQKAQTVTVNIVGKVVQTGAQIPTPVTVAITVGLFAGNSLTANECQGVMDCDIDPVTGERTKEAYRKLHPMASDGKSAEDKKTGSLSDGSKIVNSSTASPPPDDDDKPTRFTNPKHHKNSVSPEPRNADKLY